VFPPVGPQLLSRSVPHAGDPAFICSISESKPVPLWRPMVLAAPLLKCLTVISAPKKPSVFAFALSIVRLKMCNGVHEPPRFLQCFLARSRGAFRLWRKIRS
jgi:hypothetical protein